ncbi:MAG: hypothetical protein WD801_11490 [Gemmatimonadaceae bacterium]
MSGGVRVLLLEVLSVLVIVASVIAIAVPKAGDLRRGEAAARVVSDVEVLRTAVYAFYSDSAYFPDESPTGELQESLEAYLPSSFSLARSYGTMEYRNWPVAARDSVAASNVVGVTVSTRDPRIGASAAARSRGTARFTIGDRYTFLFFGG